MQPSQQLAFWVVAGSTSYKHDLVSLRGSLDKCDLFLKHFALLSCFCGLFCCVALSVKRLPTKSFSLNKPLHCQYFPVVDSMVLWLSAFLGPIVLQQSNSLTLFLSAIKQDRGRFPHSFRFVPSHVKAGLLLVIVIN